MGVIRVVAALAFVAACDKGKVEPTTGSAQPPPAPLPVAIDAMSIDEKILNGYPLKVEVRLCNDTGKTMDAVEWHQSFKATALKTGACTAYQETTGAYGYTY
ncbi:MAG TPA: hypothetical protein VMZ53_19190, partial [Kofleriaceae bacterium]|nr:hypothetical protein [Kofleriaceae bacterium]